METSAPSNAPDVANADTNTTYVRLATPADYDSILDIGVAAFAHDPIMLFWGSVKRLDPDTDTGLSLKDAKSLRSFISFVMRSCVSRKGRVLVVVKPAAESLKEEIASAVFWFPPGKRLGQHQLIRAYLDGGLDVIMNWGLGFLSRTGSQYMDPVHKIFEKSFKDRKVKRSPDDTWYMGMVFTHPRFQGQGCLSLLMKEQLQHDPTSTYIVEGTTEKSSNQYARYGFELQETFCVGRGKIGADGLPAEGDRATGAKVYPMIKWGEKDL